jgi:tetratricopeptide (TPR) repeat protein
MRAILAALAIVGSAQAETNGPVLLARDDFEMGVRFMQDRKYAGAIQAFQRVIEGRPDFYEAYNNLGISLVQVGKQSSVTKQQLENYQAAAEKFSKAAELKPNERITYLLWSETLVLIGDLPVDGRLRLSCYQGAVEKCRKAVELAPTEWEAYNKWAAILSTKLGEFTADDATRLRLYQEAADLFAKAAEHARFSGELSAVYSNWGSALVRAARLSPDAMERRTLLAVAVEKFERSARAVPNAAGTYALWGGALVERGKLTRVRGDFRDGIDRLTTSISLNPKDPAAYYNLAGAYALMDNNVMAVQMLKKCFELDANHTYYATAPQDPDLIGLRGEPSFQELFNTPGNAGMPAYNPRLGDAPR